MTKVNGKQKGNTWEREVAAHLSNVFGGSFVRTPGSGAKVGGKHVVRRGDVEIEVKSHKIMRYSAGQTRQYRGDICPPDELPRMVIEAKAYKDFPFNQLITRTECAQLKGWVRQAQEACGPGDTWFLVVKINHTGSMVIVSQQTAAALELTAGTFQDSLWVGPLDGFFETNKVKIEQLCS